MSKKTISAAAKIAASLLASCVLLCGCTNDNGNGGGKKSDEIKNSEEITASDGGNSSSVQKSDYQLFIEAHPDYEGDESQWEKDMADGKLMDSYEYNIVSGKSVSFFAESGLATKDGDQAVLSGAVCTLEVPVVLPVTPYSTWEMTVVTKGISGQFFNSSRTKENGRIYFGYNSGNSVLYLGVKIGDTFFNYCWSVAADLNEKERKLTYSFDGTRYLLSVDDETPRTFDTLNFNQGAKLTDIDGTTASKELTEKIKAVSGQAYVTMESVGANNFAVNARIKSWSVKTSGLYAYNELAAHPLAGKKIFQLGSSISYGAGSNGVSFVEQIASLTASSYVKETVSGTTLAVVDGRTNSYVERYGNFDFSKGCDVLLIQLSTNDFTQDITVGSVKNDGDLRSATKNKKTLCGAIEYLIAATRENSPETVVAFYTCPVKNSWALKDTYGEFIEDQMKTIASKYDILLIDLFNLKTLDYSSQMTDSIHPNIVVYGGVFTPNMINAFTAALKK
ncbi:MAG: SGNH/GDSL hydrolase family protein [Clostridia bacterium]|nr:SGNH/GDSL hydrolase family protein [Clostridia bacterium]